MKNTWQEKLLVWFLPTRYFDNDLDLQAWDKSERKQYIIFLRVAAICAVIICVSFHFLIDPHLTSDNAYLVTALYRISTILFCLFLLLYSYSSYFKSIRYYKAPVIFFAFFMSFFHCYYVRLDQSLPVLYCFLIPFIVVWVCQLSPGFSAALLTFLLVPISLFVISYSKAPDAYYHAIALTFLSVPMVFLMRLEVISKVKYFLLNKKYLEEMKLRLEETKLRQNETELRYKETELRYKELGDLATQVAHDIRSPLSAVMILAKDNPNIPEDARTLFRTGVTRIVDITNDLLNKGRVFLDTTKAIDGVKESETSSSFLITDVIESLVSEKRVEYRSKLGIQIQNNFNSDSFGVFANIQKSVLKRILSNLINNSVEAVKEKGLIEISAGLADKNVIISIQDDGCGIPAEIIPKLLKRGASFNKGENNLGVGLHHAYSKVTEWGGEILLESQLNKGTKITLKLPACETPKWFKEKIEITKDSKIVILDDDLAIHQVWDRRLKELRKENTSVEVIHLSTIQQFELWFQKNDSPDVLYLIDYELLGQAKSGVDIISSHNIQGRSILVTGRSEEQALIEKCLNLGIKILPKVSANMVSIEVKI